jgi:hypothetical protein
MTRSFRRIPHVNKMPTLTYSLKITFNDKIHFTGSSLAMVGLSLDLSGLTSDAFVTIKHPTVNFLIMLKSSHIISSSISVALLPGINSIQTNTDVSISK